MSTDVVWKALADPTRRQLLDELRDGPRTTGDLAEAFPLSRFGVMKHLDVLVDARLVLVRRRGRERWNYLNPVPLRQAYERWMRPYADRHADQALRLKASAEQKETPMPATDSVLTGALDIASETHVAAPREKVWQAILDIGEWWPHRFRDDSTVILEPHIGGRFFDDWGNGGALYGTVGSIEYGRHLGVRAYMGMTGPVAGVFTYDLEDDGDATILRTTHRAFGDIGDEAHQSYSEGWLEVAGALKAHLGVA